MQIIPDIVWRQQTHLIVFAQFIIILALDMSDPFWPLILVSFHSLNPRALQYWSGAIYMAPLLTTIFTTLLWVKIGERAGYKKMILRAGFALTVTQWSLVFLSNPWLIFIIRLLQGALAGFSAAAQAWTLAITPIRVHGQIVGRLQAATAMGGIIGPVFGGIFSYYFGYFSIFFTAGCVCLLISCFLGYFLKESCSQVPASKFIVNQSKKKFFFRESNRNLLLLLICCTQIARWMPIPFFALYITQELHADTLTQGFIYAIMALAMSLTAAIFGRMVDRPSNGPIQSKLWLILALLLSGLVQCGFAFIKKSYLAFTLSLLWGISLGIISLVLFTFLLKGMSDHGRAGTIGLGNTALKLGNLMGIVLGTVIQAEVHFMISFITIGGLYFALTLLAGCCKFYAEN